MTTQTHTHPTTHDLLISLSDAYARLYSTYGTSIPQSAAKRVAASCGIDDWSGFLSAAGIAPDADDMIATIDLAMVLGL